jgi:hypothetical protein
VSCDGDPIRVSICHCLACQKRTGSAFGIQSRWPSDRVKIEGRALEFVRVGDEGSAMTFRFCPTCGSTVYYDNDRIPGVIAVPVGAFADPTFPPPRVSVYGVRRHPWTGMPDLAVEELD